MTADGSVERNVSTLSREELEAEVLRLRRQLQDTSALRETETLLRRAQEAGDIGLFWVGIDDDLVRGSPHFRRLYGLPERETFSAREIEALVLSEDRALISTVEMRRRGEAPRDVEYRVRRPDNGEVRWISRKAALERDDSGRPTRFIGVARDITDQVLARRQLEDQREQLAQMFEQAPTFMALLRGPEHRIERVNPGYVRLIGGRHVVGRTIAEALPDAVEQGFLDRLDEVYASGRTYSATAAKYAVRADPAQPPTVRYVDFVYQPIRDAAGAVSGIFVEGVDVTDRTQAQAALADSERRYKTLFESIDEGFCIIEFFDGPHGPLSDYVHVEANAAYAQHAGIPDVVGQKVREMVPDEADGWIELYGEVLRTGTPIRFERELVATGRHLELAAFRIEPAGRRQVAVLFRDITEQRLAQRHQSVLLALSDRLRDLGDPGAIVAAACDLLGTTLHVSSAAYGIVDGRENAIAIEHVWTAPPAAGPASRLDFQDYGVLIEDLKRGEPVVVVDTATDPRAEGVGAHSTRTARAFVDMPLFERGRFVALLSVAHAEPRKWTDGDLALMRDVGERTRSAAERARADEGRRASEAELRLVADAVPLLVGAVDRSLTYRVANAAYRDWFALEPRQVIGRTIPQLLDAKAFDARRPMIERALAGEPARGDVEWPRLDGRPRVADIQYIPRRTPQGALDGFYVFVQDVTAQRSAEALLAERAETLEREVVQRTVERDRLWQHSNDLMGMAGLDGFLKSINPAWNRLFGWSGEELLARPFIERVDPADHAETNAVVARLAAGRTVHDFVNHMSTKDGRRLTIMWTAVPEPGTAAFHIVGRDLTELRQTEEALRQSQKMEAVGQLTGGIAHDFNNLLTGISGSLELLQARLSQGRVTEIDRYVTAAQSAAKRAAALTHRLLAFSRRQTLDPRPTDVNRLVSGMDEMLRRTIGPQITLEVVAAGGLWATLIDPPQLENALLNLCINARDAMPEGGRITIETANKWFDLRTARQRDLPPGQYVSLCVTDTGIGMSAEVMAKAFDPFFTTKPLGQGTGLGLSMIYGFVRQSGGQVRIYSEVGQGTTMCLYLPRHHADEGEGDPLLAELREAPRKVHGETVMVVDDEPTVRMLVTEVLEDLGYSAIEAADAPSGLKVLQSDVRIDLLITDVGLPGGMNGRQMADAALAHRPGLKVLFITGYAENAIVGNGHLLPGTQVMTKPFVMEVLANRIREMIET